MNTTAKPLTSIIPGRVTSVDFFRGITMFLLVGESTRLYEHFLEMDSGIMQFLGLQFSHQAWRGLHFWDLIQPFFMFIVGVAIPFAVANRIKKGQSMRTIKIMPLSVPSYYCFSAGHSILLGREGLFSDFRMSLHSCQLPTWWLSC